MWSNCFLQALIILPAVKLSVYKSRTCSLYAWYIYITHIYLILDERPKLKAPQGARREVVRNRHIPLAYSMKLSISGFLSALQILKHAAQLIRLPMIFGVLFRLQLWEAGNLSGKFSSLSSQSKDSGLREQPKTMTQMHPSWLETEGRVQT